MLILVFASVAFMQADTAATKAAILQADRSLAAAVASKGAQVFLDALAPDAAVLFPGQPILKGAAGARSAFRARYDAPSSLTWNPVHAVVSTDGRLGCTNGYSVDRVITWKPMRDLGMGAGGLAFTVGHSVSGPRAGKTGPANASKYFSVWRQEPDGRWLYIFDLGTPRPQG
jgi:ketosteroid isomerase-like protein